MRSLGLPNISGILRERFWGTSGASQNSPTYTLRRSDGNTARTSRSTSPPYGGVRPAAKLPISGAATGAGVVMCHTGMYRRAHVRSRRRARSRSNPAKSARGVAQTYLATLKVKSILNPELGDIKAAKLTTERVKEYIQTQLKKVKPRTVNRELGILHRADQLGYVLSEAGGKASLVRAFSNRSLTRSC